VKLLSFDPRKNNNGLVDATWTVAEETRMQTYVVEHSTDGNNFSTVFSIPANNNAGIHRYTANDLPLLNGKNFYRLKMIDQQQAIRYSDLRQLNNGAKNIITLYPNPAKEKIFIQSTSAGGHYRIVDPLGRTILQGTINATNNGIDIRALAAGSYWLIFDTKSTRVAHMFIKA
jgi:trimeric autotransporter adhesin